MNLCIALQDISQSTEDNIEDVFYQLLCRRLADPAAKLLEQVETGNLCPWIPLMAIADQACCIGGRFTGDGFTDGSG